jgi:tetratricopeptide (TPR) repeat protein
LSQQRKVTVSQQPKRASEGGRQAAERPVVDREEPIAVFQAALNAPQPTKPLVLVFHGSAGTGKSRLRRELIRLVDSRSPEPPSPGAVRQGPLGPTPEPPLRNITATLDFDVPINRQPDAALFFLGNALREAYRVGFPRFDLAYAFLWQKSHPDTALVREAGPEPEFDHKDTKAQVSADENGMQTLLEPGSLLSQLLDESGKLPLIGLIPKIANILRDQGIEGSRDRVPETPTSYLLPPTYYATWWRERGERELEDLPQMEPAAIVECLPRLWASDLKDFLGATSHKPQAESEEPVKNRESESYHQDTKAQSDHGSKSEGESQKSATRYLAGPERWTMDDGRGTRRAVLFIDSYEKLSQTVDGVRDTVDASQKTDAWVRELVKRLPEALWVISGRQKLRWGEVEKEWGDVLSQHELGPLPEHSARQFLSGCGITDAPIQEAIAKGSQGLPHYLNLAADTFLEIKQSGQRVPSASPSTSQPDTPEELFTQFIRHLDQPEIATLQVLSASRFWNYGLFEHLVTEYQTGYPLTSYDDISRFSFVGEGAAPETRTMHDLMREALQEHQAPELRKRVHLFLHEHYAKQLEGLDVKNITERHKAALTEAFYHGRQAMAAQELWTTLKAPIEVFVGAGQYRLVMPFYQDMAQALEAELGPDHTDTAAAFHALADDLTNQGEYEQAELHFRRALAAREKLLGPEHLDVALTLNRFALLRQQQGRYIDAEALFRRAHAVREKLLGVDHFETAANLANLGGVLYRLFRNDEAETLLRRAQAAMEKVLGPKHLNVATTLNLLACVVERKRRYREAEALYRRAIAITEQALGPEHPTVARVQHNLADLLLTEGRYAQSEKLERQSLGIQEKALGLQHPSLVNSLNVLAQLCSDRGESAEADALLRRSLAIAEMALDPEHPLVTHAVYFLSCSLRRQGKHAEAEPLLRRLLPIQENSGVGLIYSLTDLAWVLMKQGKHAEGDQFARRAIAVGEKDKGPEDPNLAVCLDTLSALLREQQRYSEAEDLTRRAIAILEKALKPEGPESTDRDVAASFSLLARLYCRVGRYAEAEVPFRRALAIREKLFGPEAPYVAETLEGLAEVCEQTGQAAEAQELSARASAIRNAIGSSWTSIGGFD